MGKNMDFTSGEPEGGADAAQIGWRWGGGSRSRRGSTRAGRSTNSNTASPEKKRRKKTA